ncbi:hypothetical protein J6590_011745 [Homalodisca vitripennis]|nr:hypothetical protein J6590_011745 [Homalodisca vitripennis]
MISSLILPKQHRTVALRTVLIARSWLSNLFKTCRSKKIFWEFCYLVMAIGSEVGGAKFTGQRARSRYNGSMDMTWGTLIVSQGRTTARPRLGVIVQ